MQARFRKIEPLLSALPVFEAAARHQSFTKAAQELNLSQPTVSHHIQNIEAWMEVPLFARRHNRVRLTTVGEQLAAAVSLGLGHIDKEVRAIQSRTQPGELTLACSIGFANSWLMPRFSSLRRAIDGYPVTLATTDWHRGFDRDSADLLVVWTGEAPSRHERIPLFPERVVPVCSPEFLNNHPELKLDDPERLATYPLLHYDEQDSGFVNWTSWFASQGVAYTPPSERYVFSNYEFLLQAVTEGEGIGLGWAQLIKTRMEAGQLWPVGPVVTGDDSAYSVEIHRGGVPDDVLDKAADWFRAESLMPSARRQESRRRPSRRS